MTVEKSVLLVELEKEIAALKERLRICEDALRELIECHQKQYDE